MPLAPLDPPAALDDLAAEEAALLARRTADLALPPPVLDGWSSLCAAEYALAARALIDHVAHASALLRSAAGAS